jgi:translation initiation factor IF-3
VVRVVGEEIEAEVMSIQDALKLADKLELDLVEISPNADPPVCKLLIIRNFFISRKRNRKRSRQKRQK